MKEVGETVPDSASKVGKTVTDSEGMAYRIEQYLGEGVTSVVYRARRESDGVEVALKLLRPEVSEVIATNFWEEGDILGALALAAQKSGEIVRVPRVMGSQRERGQDRFLALELVRGTPLSRLVEEQGPVPEVQALTIAVQVLGVLQLLHHALRRTYTDFQLQNIWVTPGSDGAEPQVKVMDWNHVSEQVPEQDALPADFGAGDLARFGAYFYRMATGKGAYERGETRRALAQRAGAQWEALSLGTRQILLRALHPDPTRRFASAQAFCEAAQAQLARWSDEDAFHTELGEAGKRLRALAQVGEQNPPTLEADEAEWLDAILDMAEKRGLAAQVERYLTRLRQETGDVSVAWRAGEQYYQAGQYHEAVEKWRAEAVALGEVRFHRWVLLAEAGAAHGNEFKAVRLPLEEALAALEQREFDKAYARVQQLPATLTAAPAVESLRWELRAFRKVAEAEEGEQADNEAGWEQAAKAYQEAEAALAKVPYQELLREEEGWTGLSARAQQLVEQLATRRAMSGVARDSRARLASDFEAGRKAIEAALRRDPSHVGLIRLCLEEARQRIETVPAQALALAETALLFAHLTPELRAHLVACLNDARQAEEARQEKEREDEKAKQARERQEAEAQQKKSKLDELGSTLETAVEKKQWVMVRTLAAKLEPGAVTLSELPWRDIVDALRKSFDEAVGHEVEPLALILRESLDRLDASPEQVRQRREGYERMAVALKERRDNWGKRFLAQLEREERNLSTEQDYEAWITRIDEASPLAEGDAVLKQTLIDKRNDFVNGRDKAKRDEAERKRAKAQREAEGHLALGWEALALLTPAGWDMADAKFRAAKKSLEGWSSDDPDDLIGQADKALDAADGLKGVPQKLEKVAEDIALANENKRFPNGQNKETIVAAARKKLEEAEATVKAGWAKADRPSPQLPLLATLREKLAAPETKPIDAPQSITDPAPPPLWARALVPTLGALVLLSLLDLGGDALIYNQIKATQPSDPSAVTTPQTSLDDLATRSAEIRGQISVLGTQVTGGALTSTPSPEATEVAPATPTVAPPETATPEPNVEPTTIPAPVIPPVALEVTLPEGPLYELPPLTQTTLLGVDWTFRLDEDDPSKVLVETPDEFSGLPVQLWVDETPIEGRMSLTNTLTWAPNDPGIDPGIYTLSFQVQPDEGEPILLSKPRPFEISYKFGFALTSGELAQLALLAEPKPDAAIIPANAPELADVTEAWEALGVYTLGGGRAELYQVYLRIRPVGISYNEELWITWDDIRGVALDRIPQEAIDELPDVVPGTN